MDQTRPACASPAPDAQDHPQELRAGLGTALGTSNVAEVPFDALVIGLPETREAAALALRGICYGAVKKLGLKRGQIRDALGEAYAVCLARLDRPEQPPHPLAYYTTLATNAARRTCERREEPLPAGEPRVLARPEPRPPTRPPSSDHLATCRYLLRKLLGETTDAEPGQLDYLHGALDTLQDWHRRLSGKYWPCDTPRLRYNDVQRIPKGD